MEKGFIENMVLNSSRSNSVFHDLMQYRVREILLVASIYDSFIMDREREISERLFGEYFQLNISNAPRVTSANSPEQALLKLKTYNYSMVVIMMGLEKNIPITLAKAIKEKHPKLPVLLLLNNNSDIHFVKENINELVSFDKVFVWNGDSRIFLGMVKYIEDKMNVKRDTQKAMVRVILLVEDSIKYYSRYLPNLYTVIMKQTQALISQESDLFEKMLRMKARPKVLLATNYEEAVHLYRKYKEYILCVISDVKYKKDGVSDPDAGLKLIKFLKDNSPNIPTLLQSSDISNRERAFDIKSSFIYKNSETLLQELKEYFLQNLGFGSFVFRSDNGDWISSANTIEELQKILEHIPVESLEYHSRRNHFSAWFMARGEIKIAKKLAELSVNDFKSIEEIREFLIILLKSDKHNKQKGEIIDFSEQYFFEESYILRLADGAYGGKGRGLAFINHLIENLNISDLVPEIEIKMPKTAIIGTDEFEEFIERNQISHKNSNQTFKEVQEQFLKGKLSDSLRKKLRCYIRQIQTPIAVRSSGLFEDSLLHPFSGVYTTYLIPNNHPNEEIRFQMLTNAIKLVYSSLFSPHARNYFDAISYKVEEEKMAVILQEVTGKVHGEFFYPDLSGVAQSYNYYPISYMKPEDGIAVLAIGLGKYVVEGEKSFRFCPNYPKVDFLSMQEQFKASQNYFFAIDLKNYPQDLSSGEEATLKKLDVKQSEESKLLHICASTFDIRSNRLVAGANSSGPKVINFANIVKYGYIPLAELLKNLLEVIEYSMHSPVEIEFSVDLNLDKKNRKPIFNLLQIKPLIKGEHFFDIDLNKLNKDDLILYTEKGLGNGKIDDIEDIIFVDPELFDKSETLEMVEEIELLNDVMKKQGKKYVLIGPGRWGSSDRWLGIPVVWSQISHAKLIVEMNLKNFYVDASCGSHFFHNITSMNVGYLTIRDSSEDFIQWDVLKEQKTVHKTKHCRHVKFSKPFTIMMDGKKGISMICCKDN
ncbi:pyruvate, phosphate dikinase [bacterium]|nr:pyruvate, phosphate dikinase [bacterium]